MTGWPRNRNGSQHGKIPEHAIRRPQECPPRDMTPASVSVCPRRSAGLCSEADVEALLSEMTKAAEEEWNEKERLRVEAEEAAERARIAAEEARIAAILSESTAKVNAVVESAQLLPTEEVCSVCLDFRRQLWLSQTTVSLLLDCIQIRSNCWSQKNPSTCFLVHQIALFRLFGSILVSFILRL